MLERIAALAANPDTEVDWVCAECGAMIAVAAGFFVPEPFINTGKVAAYGVCGRANRREISSCPHTWPAARHGFHGFCPG